MGTSYPRVVQQLGDRSVTVGYTFASDDKYQEVWLRYRDPNSNAVGSLISGTKWDPGYDSGAMTHTYPGINLATPYWLCLRTGVGSYGWGSGTNEHEDNSTGFWTKGLMSATSAAGNTNSINASSSLKITEVYIKQENLLWHVVSMDSVIVILTLTLQ